MIGLMQLINHADKVIVTFFLLVFLFFVSIIAGIYYFIKYLQISKLTIDSNKVMRCLFRSILFGVIVPLAIVVIISQSIANMLTELAKEMKAANETSIANTVAVQSQRNIINGHLVLCILGLLMCLAVFFCWHLFGINSVNRVKLAKTKRLLPAIS